MFERILVPLDGSRFGSMAVQYATEIAQRYGAEVILMNAVVPAPIAPGMVEVSVRSARLEDEHGILKVKRYLQRKTLEVTKQGVSCSYRLLIGQPVRSILHSCHKERADLVVMSTRGKGGLKRAVLGSVADQVTRESKIPVLLVQRGRRRAG